MPRRPAFFASPTENHRSISSPSGRVIRQNALVGSSSLSNHSLILKPRDHSSAGRASPQMFGLPLMTAKDCMAWKGAKPSSAPAMMATNTCSGLSTPLGVMPDAAMALATRNASSSDCGTRAETWPPATICGRG
ncbi:hypothetical protein D9M72_599730 [compost metagenome]